MKLPLSASLLALCILFTAPSFADYTVQIGAYRSSVSQAVKQAEPYGEVFQTQGDDQLVRISIGRFIEKSKALALLENLKISGFNDAFVTLLDNHETSYVNTQNQTETISEKKWLVKDTYQNNAISIDQLSADERRNAAYLDDTLMIFSNGEFYTIEQYRSR